MMNIHFLLKCFLFEGKHSLIFVELVGPRRVLEEAFGSSLEDLGQAFLFCVQIDLVIFFLGGGFKHPEA